jgi:uncharacterized protein (UPF0303 family)
MHPAKHKKRKQRMSLIAKLQKRVKSSDISQTDARKLNMKIRKLQKQNDHVAVIYDNLCG